MSTKTFIVDIDQTICITPFNNGNHEYTNCVAIPDRISKINKLYDDGHTIIYWTARGGSTGLDWTSLTKQQLHSWGCKYHELRMKKPNYDVFICDKAFNSEEYFK